MTRLARAILLPLIMACGETRQDTGAAEDTAACETDAEIVAVCECNLTLDWSSANYSVTMVGILGLKMTALEIKEALCEGSLVVADVTGNALLKPEDGATELLVGALDAPAVVVLHDSTGLVATLILDPDAEESNSTVVFE